MSAITSFFAGLGLGLSLWAWLLILVEFIILGVCAQKRSGIFGLVSLAAFSAAFYFIGGPGFVKSLASHPLETTIWTVGYIGIGVLWSFFKWGKYSVECKEGLDEEIKAFIEKMLRDLKRVKNSDSPNSEHRIVNDGAKNPQTIGRWIGELSQDKIPDELIPIWQEGYHVHKVPIVTQHKNMLFSWIILWPFSMLGYVLSDILSDLADWLVKRFHWVYARITNHAYRNIDPRLLKKA
ncbi:MAG TPA: hypothetical protein VFT82_01735 [Candidatus Paceibacterota bacterium]|nr:hypothetical protein [Candidatus Paceibacterota bacterium]